MLKQKRNFSNWINYTIRISPSNFTKDLLNSNLNKFWNDIVIANVSEDQHIIFLFRLQWNDNQFATIGNLQKLNNDDKDYIFNYILDEIKDKSEYYLEQSIISIVFTYAIREGRALEKIVSKDTQFHHYQHHKLPITMDPLKYGDLLYKNNNDYAIQINETNIAIISIDEGLNKVKLFRKGKLRYEYTDRLIDNQTFIRTLGNKEWIFRNNEQLLYQIEKTTKFINPLIRTETLQNKFLTLDIETFIKDGIHIPYAISIFDGLNTLSYYLTDFKDSNAMLISAIKNIMVKKYDNYKVYIHNMARFDAIFLLKILANLGEIKPIIHNDKIISITFRLNDYVLTFKDSQQMLIGSLRSLAKSFGVETQKSIFPYDFVNENNLNYNASVPNINYFNNLSREEYLNYYDSFNSNNWNLKNETVKYCNIDCISLYQVIIKFNQLIFELFNINIHKYPTLSSLAFAIFRTVFLENNTIPQLSGQVAKDIRQGYTGGAVDMHLPENPEGVQLYAYDVNSLYPSIMLDKDMPVGKPVLFEGNIRVIEPNAFGFFYCEIIAPDNLKHPILQTHIKTDSGIRTIAPLGKWKDMIFSAEMDNAMKLGYKFEILWGYKFERKNVFKSFVNTLYNLRLNYPKSNPLNLIAKLLLNSLYGRFGMIDSFPNIKIINRNEMDQFIDDFGDDGMKFIELGNKILVIYRSNQKDINTLLDGHKESHNVSIGIASAITSYARIHMSQFKNNLNYNLYYTDTDSIYIDKPLPENLVNDKILGKMKLENIIKKAIFLAPKVYYLETVDGKGIYKVKGLSHNIELNINDFKNLLYKDSFIEKTQIKWRKHIDVGNISVIEQLYTLKVTDNKRKLIYQDNKLIGTNPYIINRDEIINK